MDLKIKDVAELLNVSETTIQRWLSEGKIPAYRLHDEVRFDPGEIEDWILGGGDTLEEEHPAQVGNMQFSLYRALYRGDVLANVRGKTKEEIIRATMEKMGERFDLDPAVLTDLFLGREQMMPTTLGHGIGVPHTRDFLLDTHYDVVMVVYPEDPINYGALDGEPVNTLFFLFACEDRHHLNLLAKIAHLNVSEKTRAFFKTMPSKDEVLKFVKNWESSLRDL